MTIKDIFERMDYGPAPEATDHADAWLEGRERRFDHLKSE